MEEKTIIPVKGMKDYYPEEYSIVRYLENTWLDTGKIFGYEEYEGPTLEPAELYLEKSSEEIVSGQTFRVFDRNGKILIMRPEMTPTLARMICQKEHDLVMPIRWQSFGRFYRYEKPQKGRLRAFYQWNVDLIGSDTPASDFEILQIACESLSKLGLTKDDVEIKVGNRKIIQNVMQEKLGIPEALVMPVLRILDRMDKVTQGDTVKDLKDLGLSGNTIVGLIRLLESDPRELGYWFSEMDSMLKSTDIGGFFKFDLRIIRGFDYYTGVVFEAWAKKGIKRALFGGGRYDNLTRQVGGKLNLPGIGFGAGDVAITELLKDMNMLPQTNAADRKILVTIFDNTLMPESMKIVQLLRDNNIAAELFLDPSKNLGKQLKYADRKNFTKVIIIGSEEVKNNCVMIKDLVTSDQINIDKNNLVDFLGR